MRALFVVAALLVGFVPATPAEEPEPVEIYNLGENRMALQGYDVVSYFTDNKAMPGKSAYTVTYHGVKYQFSTEEHLRMFRQEPEKYVPRYGGWCAFGLGMDPETYGYPRGKYSIDPETFKILDGRLYLFYNQDGFNALEHWNKDESHIRAEADGFWKKLIRDAGGPE